MSKSEKPKNPLQKGQKNISALFEENKDFILETSSFMSTATIKYDSSKYKLTKQNQFFYPIWNRIFLVKKFEKSLRISLATNFIVTDVRECTLIYNDKSGKLPSKFYLVTLKNDSGVIEKDIELSNNSKSDYAQFQSVLNKDYTGFLIQMKEAEFKTFIAKFVSPKVSSKVTIYNNAGKTPEGYFLYENALAKPNEIVWADKNGYIKTAENTYIKLAEATHNLPRLTKSDKTGVQIAKELMTNIKECWSEDVVLPLMTLGHMVMALFYDDFIKRYGAPTLLLYGDTGTGKSTLVVVGLSIFGLSKDSLTSGGSTSKSSEHFCARYNCMNVCIDDIKGETLNSSNFTALVKGMYKGVPRTRMLSYGKGVEYIHTCSPLAYSTNDPLPNLREVINRLNVIEIFGKKFQAENFKYHELDNANESKLPELSLILPEFLKYTKNSIIDMYEKNFAILEANVKDTQRRVINNIAYAYTGAQMLLSISSIEFEDLEAKVIEFAQQQVERYENIKTVVDRVFSEIILLNKLGYILEDNHFRVVRVDTENGREVHLRFHKDTVLAIINRYYIGDKKKQIDESTFLSYAKNHPRYRGNNHTVRYNDSKSKGLGSLCFDVTALPEFEDYQYLLTFMNADEFNEHVKQYMEKEM